MWYLIVSIPDLCTLTYFETVLTSLAHGQDFLIMSPLHFLSVTVNSFLSYAALLDLYPAGASIVQILQVTVVFKAWYLSTQHIVA